MYCSKRYIHGALKIKITRAGIIETFYLVNNSLANNTSVSICDYYGTYCLYAVMYKNAYNAFKNIPGLNIKGAVCKKGDTVSFNGNKIKLESNYDFKKLIHDIEIEMALQ